MTRPPLLVRAHRTAGMACCIACIACILAVKVAIEAAYTATDWARRAAR